MVRKNLFKLPASWCAVKVSKVWVKFLFWFYLIFLVWSSATVTNPADPDLWHRLALGEYLAQKNHFPAGGTFSYLADYQYVVDHEWGSALLFYALYQWAGSLDIFVAVKLITLTATLVPLVQAGLQHRKPTLLLAAFYALVLLALLPSFQSTVRCMTFTHIFFALWLYWFQRERHGRPVATVWYVVTAIFWANLHGGYAIGLAWLFLLGLIELVYPGDWKKWAVRFGFSSLATLVNPFGVYLWISTVRALVTTRSGFNEWAPVSWWPDPMVYPGYKLLLLLVLVGLIFYLRYRPWKRADRLSVILIGAFGFLSLISARHTSLFASVVGALLPGLYLVEPGSDRTAHPLQQLGQMAIRFTLLIIPLYSALIVLPDAKVYLEFPHVACPRDGIQYLKNKGIRGNLLVPFNYGSYALWELRGKMRVSMDGRYDLVYRPKTYQRVDDFFFARGDWKSLLTTPKPDAILLPIANPIYPKLKAESGWVEAWRDETDAVFLPLAK